MSRTVFYGLPTSVDSVDKLPKHAFDGHLCYVKAEEDGGLYVFNGEQYDAVSVSSGGGGGSDTPTDVIIPSDDTLPGTPEDGQLAFLTTDDSAYVYNGTAWQQISVVGDVIQLNAYATVNGETDPLPADAAEGSIAYVTGQHAPYVKTNTEWKRPGLYVTPSTNVVAPTAADTDHYPSNPTAGMLVWLTGTGLQVYDGTAWKTVTVS